MCFLWLGNATTHHSHPGIDYKSFQASLFSELPKLECQSIPQGHKEKRLEYVSYGAEVT